MLNSRLNLGVRLCVDYNHDLSVLAMLANKYAGKLNKAESLNM